MTTLDGEAILDFFDDPVFVVQASGEIIFANRAATQTLGANPSGDNLSEYVSSPPDSLRQYLHRCSGVTAPVVGALSMRDRSGAERRYRTYAARLRGGSSPPQITLRCVPTEKNEFSVLARKVQELNGQIRERRQIEASLQEQVATNEVLLGELQHRVKNTIQMLLALFSSAEREANSEDLRVFLRGANRRLLAIGSTQSLLYEARQLQAVPLRSLVETLSRSIADAFGSEVDLHISVEDDLLPANAALALALVLNELLTNAFKYGVSDDAGTVGIYLHRVAEGYSLSVHDTGPGFEYSEDGRRSSGLGLVRGLCRQLGGRLAFDHHSGTRATVLFAPGQAQ